MDAETPVPQLPLAVVSEQTYLRIPSRPEWVEPTVEYLKIKAIACGACHEARALKLTLALHEALTNSLVHGNLEVESALKEQGDHAFAEALAARSADPQYAGRSIHIRVSYDADRCTWVLTDEGKGFDVEQVLRRSEDDSADCVLASGRGIALMRAFLDDVSYELGGRRVVLTLRRASGAEKRQQARLPFHERVEVTPLRADGSPDWEAAYEAVSRNLSPDGMALLQAGLASSDRLLIGLITDSGPIYLPAEVRHWEAVGDNVVELGCRFEAGDRAPPPPAPAAGPAAGEEIDALVEHYSHRPLAPDERRDFPRVIYTERIGVVSGPGARPEFGFARDLSKGGIAFIATIPLPRGGVRLLLPQAEGRRPLAVCAEIVRCTKVVDGFYDVGARFVRAEPRPAAAAAGPTAVGVFPVPGTPGGVADTRGGR
jgi:anti-sigma regulatory factor (Ser/Thr protein kinase)